MNLTAIRIALWCNLLPTPSYPLCSVFYVYYEQYLTIFGDFFLNIGLSLGTLIW